MKSLAYFTIIVISLDHLWLFDVYDYGIAYEMFSASCNVCKKLYYTSFSSSSLFAFMDLSFTVTSCDDFIFTVFSPLLYFEEHMVGITL